jgi:yeast amino acid transporter
MRNQSHPEPAVNMSSYRAPDKDYLGPNAAELNNHHGGETSQMSSDEATGDFRAMDPQSGVKRGLKTRHLSMMALAGIIGPGLLVGSGGALSNGGPAALLIGFGTIGILAFSIMQSIGELTTLYPSGGAFTALADRFVDKAFGVAVGWNYFIICERSHLTLVAQEACLFLRQCPSRCLTSHGQTGFTVLANEYNAISSILVFWSDKLPLWGYFLLLWVGYNQRSHLCPKHFISQPRSICRPAYPLVTCIVCLPWISAHWYRDLR